MKEIIEFFITNFKNLAKECSFEGQEEKFNQRSTDY